MFHCAFLFFASLSFVWYFHSSLRIFIIFLSFTSHLFSCKCIIMNTLPNSPIESQDKNSYLLSKKVILISRYTLYFVFCFGAWSTIRTHLYFEQSIYCYILVKSCLLILKFNSFLTILYDISLKRCIDKNAPSILNTRFNHNMMSLILNTCSNYTRNVFVVQVT